MESSMVPGLSSSTNNPSQYPVVLCPAPELIIARTKSTPVSTSFDLPLGSSTFRQNRRDKAGLKKNSSKAQGT
nr:hypothetical protein HmN_000057300 [Hymenolepis microstoma]